MSQEQFDQFVSQNHFLNDDSIPTYSQFQQYMAQQNLGDDYIPEQPSPSAQPETEASRAKTQMSINDILNSSGREKLTLLDPSRSGRATWFKHENNKITKTILTMMKSTLKKAYPTYRSFPLKVKKRWFRAFAQQFDWSPGITKKVEVEFETQAKLSFSNNLHSWKDAWKEGRKKPIWMKNIVWKGYIKMWSDTKVAATASNNSRNRNSKRGGDGVAKHNTGAKTFQRRKNELTAANGGVEPDMLTFIEDIHTNKSGEISDLKVKRIVETVKEKMHDRVTQLQSQEGSLQSNTLSSTQINELVLEVTPVVNGSCFGFGSIPIDGTGSPVAFNPEQGEELHLAKEKIALLEKNEVKKDKAIKYWTDISKLLLKQFPNLNVPENPEDDDDEDETQP